MWNIHDLMIDQITGDDTPALQAVLDADVWRKHLLKEQEVGFLDRSLGISLMVFRKFPRS